MSGPKWEAVAEVAAIALIVGAVIFLRPIVAVLVAIAHAIGFTG